MLALLPILAGDIPWSAGGLMRCFDLVAEEGTINNASFPAAVSRGPIGPAWLTGNLVAECLSPDARPVAGARACTCRRPAAAPGTPPSSPGSTSAAPVPNPFLSIMMDPMAGGYGAQPAGRRHGHRRAVLHPDGPGAGRRDDGVPLPGARPVAPRGARLGRPGPAARRACPRRWRSPRTARASRSASSWRRRARPISQNNGLAGGYPGNTGVEWIARGSDRRRRCSAPGGCPPDLDEIGGDAGDAALLRRDLRGARRGVHDVLAGRRRVRRPADP